MVNFGEMMTKIVESRSQIPLFFFFLGRESEGERDACRQIRLMTAEASISKTVGFKIKQTQVRTGGGSQQEPCLGPLGKAQHVDGAHDTGLDRFDGVVLVMGWRCWAGQVIDLIDLNHEWIHYIVSDHLKVWVAQPVLHIPLTSCEKVVEDNDFVAHEHQAVDKMRSHKACSSCDQDPFPLLIGQHLDGRIRRRVWEGQRLVLCIDLAIRIGLVGQIQLLQHTEWNIRPHSPVANHLHKRLWGGCC